MLEILDTLINKVTFKDVFVVGYILVMIVAAIYLSVDFILALRWYLKNKVMVLDKSFFMLKDKVNNIY